LKAHLIILDFLTLRMPGMKDQLSIIFSFQPIGEKKLDISFENIMEWHSQGLEPAIGLDILPLEILFVGLLFCFLLINFISLILIFLPYYIFRIVPIKEIYQNALSTT
jgi:hypothetical protein